MLLLTRSSFYARRRARALLLNGDLDAYLTWLINATPDRGNKYTI